MSNAQIAVTPKDVKAVMEQSELFRTMLELEASKRVIREMAQHIAGFEGNEEADEIGKPDGGE